MNGSSRLMMASTKDANCAAGPSGAPDGFQDVHAVQQAVCERTVELALGTHRGNLKAIILTGSLARQEGTFLREAGGWRQFGDAEFLLVFEEKATLPLTKDLLNLEGAVESELLARGLRCKISLAAVHSKYLRQLQPHIFAYELRTNGRLLWGEPVLSSIPQFLSTAIPFEDAWRLLCNRMIELLEASVTITDGSRKLPKEVFYQTVKLYIDMGTSFLVFAGGYEPTYAGRAEKMRNIQTQGSTTNRCPLDLARFAQRVMACTEYKLSGMKELRLPEISEGQRSAFWEEAIDDAHLLWHWELSQLTRANAALPDRELTGRWMQQQPVKQRLRGWLFVLRREGWHRSWRNWPSWVGQALRRSPRYSVYAAASELLFKLPALISEGSKTEEYALDELLNWLPVRRAMSCPTPDWRQVASEIVWNYHLFLVGTRS